MVLEGVTGKVRGGQDLTGKGQVPRLHRMEPGHGVCPQESILSHLANNGALKDISRVLATVLSSGDTAGNMTDSGLDLKSPIFYKGKIRNTSENFRI